MALDYGDACLQDSAINFDVDWNLTPTPLKRRRTTGASAAPVSANRTKRKYNTDQANRTRQERKALRAQGIDPGSHYKPKNGKTKRRWVASGKYVGANIKKGGSLRQFRNMEKYRQVPSKFLGAADATEASIDAAAAAAKIDVDKSAAAAAKQRRALKVTPKRVAQV